MKPAAIVAFVAALAASSAAGAQGVGLRVGDAGGWIAPALGVRIGDFPADLGRPSRLSGFLDWRPSGQLRLSAGLVARNDRADIGGLSGMVEPGNTIAPYLGIGYGHVPRAGLNFYFDLGVIYQGSGYASLASACGASMSSAQCAQYQYQSDAAAPRYGLERSLDKYGLSPVGRVGISLGF